VRWPFSFLDTTRFLYLRAQRARVAVDASIHASVRIAEPCLLSVESGAQLEPGVIIENALHATGRVRIDAVFIGAGCLIGAHAMLMPGVSLGHEARVSPGSYLGPDVSIGVGAKIGERAILAAAVDVGSHARIGAGAVIGEGVVIGEHARVAAGAVIPPKSQIREGEVWQGVPARPMNRDVRGRPRDSS